MYSWSVYAPSTCGWDGNGIWLKMINNGYTITTWLAKKSAYGNRENN